MELFGKFPEAGEKAETDDVKITVESLNARRIGVVKLELKSKEGEGEKTQ